MSVDFRVKVKGFWDRRWEERKSGGIKNFVNSTEESNRRLNPGTLGDGGPVMESVSAKAEVSGTPRTIVVRELRSGQELGKLARENPDVLEMDGVPAPSASRFCKLRLPRL